MSASKQPEERETALLALQPRSTGLFRVYFFEIADGVRLLVAGMAGDQWSLGMLSAITKCMRHSAEVHDNGRAFCLTCQAPLLDLTGLVICVVLPRITQPHDALGSAVCRVCAALPNLEKRVLVGLRQTWPDLREVSVMPGPEAVQ